MADHGYVRPADPARALALALRLSVLWDLGSLLLLWWMPAWLLEWFAHPVPAEPFLFRLAALPLLMAPIVYWMAGQDPRGRPLLVSASVQLRVVGGLGILGLVLLADPPVVAPYLGFALADLGWGAAYWLLQRRS